jgi:protein O-mannosyl-transferase
MGKSKTRPLRRISAEEFARRLRMITKETDKWLAVFLGAGCSVSSGIPAAGDLVKGQWLPRLRDFCAPECKDSDTWAKDQFPDYNPKNPATLYGAVMERLFLSPEERQREIENLCDGKFPGFGYAVLASLVAIEGGHLNVVLTTNFDDLMADALYLFSQARPLVIHHESLASYIRPTRTRPLVVKLHGDNRLSPKNTADETNRLKEDIDKQVRSVLRDRGLIFIGYGGNDVGIKEMLEAVPTDGLPLGVFWISRAEPQGIIRPWLESRNAIWVEKGDFDELMLLVRDSFNLPHPDQARFDDVFGKYKATYDALSARIVKLPSATPDASAMKEAVKRADQSFSDAWAVVVTANRLQETDPDQANTVYAKGLEQFPSFAPLLGNYANFLYTVRKNYDGAEEYYRRAMTADPNGATNLGNYAIFLKDVRKDYDGVEEHYRRALAADPNHANNLGNYANFLYTVRKNYDGAEEHYRRALVADPNHANNLGNYANLLHRVHKDYDGAEEYYRRALAADPNHANNLGNYAGLLLARGKGPEGLAVLEKVLSLPAVAETPSLAAECWFYAFAHRSAKGRDEALRNLKRVLEAGARSPDWDLAPNIAQARKHGHPDAVWLKKLAAVISDGADIKTLDAWPRWKKA